MPLPQDLHALEAAAFAAWPALEQQTLGPWLLRYAHGYTKRANSANALVAVNTLGAQERQAIEAFFESRDIPPTFRLASFCAPSGVDEALAAQGYRYLDLSLVMGLPLANLPPDGARAAALHVMGRAADWLAVYSAISAHQGEDQATHLAMLQAIAGPCAYAVLRDAQGEPLSCGLAVASADGLLGLFDLTTRADQRGRGHAATLCQGLLSWGRQQGCHLAYLQVMAHNTSAIGLYERLGFRRCYHYWYRVQSSRRQRSRVG